MQNLKNLKTKKFYQELRIILIVDVVLSVIFSLMYIFFDIKDKFKEEYFWSILGIIVVIDLLYFIPTKFIPGFSKEEWDEFLAKNGKSGPKER
ncbi:MAG: hypothetical protein N4A44_03205 [Alphaproteobacteria bacterium]|jgi:hypothetical protein|nr:hypothetical protein [Alphaproteobacteria bacterium]